MADYNFLMESRLSPNHSQAIAQLSRAASEQGMNLYLVGGAVRDLTYGQQTIHDLDFAVEGDPRRILRRLSATRARPSKHATSASQLGERPALEIESVRFDSRLNSAEVTFSKGVRVELSACRNEVYARPGKRPEITPAMIFDDLKRRDFSANAMAVSLHPNSRGLLLDPTNGAAEIEKRELRVLYSRSFLDDPTRIYRLLRLGMRLGFKPEERTKVFLETALQNRAGERMEPEQQGRELRAVLQEENPGRVLKMLAERGLLAGLDRKLASVKIPYERFAKIRAVAASSTEADPFLLNFHSLVAKLSSGQKSRLARKIIADGSGIQMALGLDRAARQLVRALSNSKNAAPSRVYRLLSGQPPTLLLFLLAHYPQATIENQVKNFLHKYPLIRARLPRAEFQAMGMKPGPKFERILERVFFDQLDGKIKTPQQMMKQLRALAGIKEPPPTAQAKPAKPKKAPKSSQPAAVPALKAKKR